jgi:hypothetical protein
MENSHDLHAGIFAATGGSNTQMRRRAKLESPEAYANYHPETYVLDQIRNRSCQQIHFMLLSMILDLSRKIAYMRIATSPAVADGYEPLDPDLAARIAAHSSLLEDFDTALPDIDWEQRAERVWRILLKDLLENVEQEQAQAIQDRAGADRIAHMIRDIENKIVPTSPSAP